MNRQDAKDAKNSYSRNGNCYSYYFNQRRLGIHGKN
jgi:hypothetical protein